MKFSFDRAGLNRLIAFAMKKPLALLLAYMLIQAQTWALSGGPVYTFGTAVQGTYAGVLVPSLVNRIFDNPATVPSANSDANSLGIFVVGVPATGAFTGQFLFFNEGEAFFGDMQGIADTEDATFRALLSGAASTNNTSSGAEFLSPLSVVGKLEAELKNASSVQGSVRLEGEAFVQLQGFVPDSSPSGFGFATLREIVFVVDGFKQSATVGNVTLNPPNTASVQPPTTTP
jgi:hypothetical protein